MWCAAAPRRWARSWISRICARFAWVIVVLIWNSSPARFIASIPASAPSKAPGTPRKASWLSASGPSRLMLTRRIPDLDQLLRDGFGHQGPVRRQDHPEPLPVPVGGDLIDVRPQERLAARQDDDRFADGRDLIEEPQAFFGAEFPLVGTAQGGGAAVAAGQVAAPGHLPGDHPEGVGQNMRMFSLISLSFPRNGHPSFQVIPPSGSIP